MTIAWNANPHLQLCDLNSIRSSIAINQLKFLIILRLWPFDLIHNSLIPFCLIQKLPTPDNAWKMLLQIHKYALWQTFQQSVIELSYIEVKLRTCSTSCSVIFFTNGSNEVELWTSFTRKSSCSVHIFESSLTCLIFLWISKKHLHNQIKIFKFERYVNCHTPKYKITQV